jgi:hypothetical protein
LPGEEISPELKRFIQEAINSVDQLEVLLFLMSNPDREWTVEEITDRTRLTEDSVRDKLQGLSRAQIIVESPGPAPTYCYAPNSPALATEVAQSLDLAYKERRDTVIQLIYSRPMDNIRVFADAFRIRKND